MFDESNLHIKILKGVRMNTQTIHVVFIDVRTKIRNEAMPILLWIIFVVAVDSTLLWLGVHWSVGLLPLLVIAFIKFQRRKNPNY